MDAKLAAYLRAADEAERERLLNELILNDAEPLVRATIRSRLRSYFGRFESQRDMQSIDDLCQDVLAKLIFWVRSLPRRGERGGVTDFRQYAVRAAFNRCYDYLREKYPARTRLKDNLRDLLDRHPDFALWKDEREEFLAGFAAWEGRPLGRAGAERARKLLIDQTPLEKDLKGGDPHQRPLTQLVDAILKRLEGPVELEALVNLLAALLDLREQEAVSIEDHEIQLSKESVASEVRADNQIEMRELLKRLWVLIDELPAGQRKCFFYSFTTRHDDLFSLLLAFGVVDPPTIAARLEIPLIELVKLKDEMPLKNQQIADLLGESCERVGKWIFLARKKVRDRLFPALAKK
jgi:RNA polymerase sigma factor (sigma-70 family)